MRFPIDRIPATPREWVAAQQASGSEPEAAYRPMLGERERRVL
jgi:hypothetical protein